MDMSYGGFRLGCYDNDGRKMERENKKWKIKIVDSKGKKEKVQCNHIFKSFFKKCGNSICIYFINSIFIF